MFPSRFAIVFGPRTVTCPPTTGLLSVPQRLTRTILITSQLDTPKMAWEINSQYFSLALRSHPKDTRLIPVFQKKRLLSPLIGWDTLRRMASLFNRKGQLQYMSSGELWEPRTGVFRSLRQQSFETTCWARLKNKCCGWGKLPTGCQPSSAVDNYDYRIQDFEMFTEFSLSFFASVFWQAGESKGD